MGAFDGAYIAGGITQRHADLLADSPFRKGFERKCRHHDLLEKVPTAIIIHPQPGLAGAASIVRKMASL